MPESYKTIAEMCSAEIIEKKSRFIAELSPALTEQEAIDFIKSRKKIYHDAKHTCSAYIIGADGRILHSSDDGEPSGTAGKPMLSILEGSGLRNVVAAVTRYFGGVLLGTGGLVRAYSGALEKCMAGADIKTYIHGSKIKIEASYSDAGRLQYMFSSEKLAVISSEYAENVSFTLIVPLDTETSLLNRIVEETDGRACSSILEHDFFML